MDADNSDLTRRVQQRLLAACGRVSWRDESNRKGFGTGYLVSSDLVMTCDHVLGSDPLAAGWAVTVTLADGEYGASILRRDSSTDCALLRLARPTPTSPLALSSLSVPSSPFWSAGFPAIGERAPVLLSGHVQAIDWPDSAGVFSTVLFSPMIAAGRGALAQGFSGSPVLVGELCVGHLTSIIPDAGATTDKGRRYAQLGYLYACRSSDILSLTAGLVAATLALPAQPAIRREPTRLSLRKLLLTLIDDIEFDSFLSNHYPTMYRRHISAAMPPLKKIDVLLVQLSDEYNEVLDKLRADYSRQFERQERILEYE